MIHARRCLTLALIPALLGALTLLPGCPVPPPGDTRYFLVAERSEVHGDAYILPLSDPADIAHALGLIDDPEAAGAPIVMARIATGPGAPPNRDLAGDGGAWSWHVVEFLGFADFSAEIYDGWPTYLEENLDEWLTTTGDTIGFWNYTVVREVQPCELDETCP